MKKKEKNTKKFRPWLENLQNMAMCSIASVASYYFLHQKGKATEFAVVITILTAMIAYNWKIFSARLHGQKVEKKALKNLRSIVGDNLTENVLIPGCGDADGVISINGKIFNIEIKSIGTECKVTAKHLDQVRSQSTALNSIPVIWLPEANKEFFTEKNGIKIMGCNARKLVGKLT